MALRNAARHAAQHAQQTRPASVWTRLLGSPEARAAQRKELEADIRSGYFSDLAELRRNAGKAQVAPTALAPAATAPLLPSVSLFDTTGAAALLPLPGATLLAVVCVAGAQRHADSWSLPFAAAHDLRSQPGPALAQLNLVDGRLFALPLVRGALCRSASAALPPATRGCTHLRLAFGNSAALRAELGVANRLAGHVFLVDSRGRLRWRGSGEATPPELDSLLACTAQLLVERG